ncbi:MAG TPA: hydroxymethylbilane synthase [Acidobacteriaceae bacterium]|nr:hydroxymethylbilane synthase [Acidobacteriaceae bacterium]
MIRIGSRGSQLARWQAQYIAAHLHALGCPTTIEIITTTGDRIQNAPFVSVGTKGMFIKEIEEALLEDRIDLAVHSLKDLPTELPPEFCIAAVPQRADASDAFVSVHHQSLQDLPKNSVVGTSSLRRQAQVRALRPDLQVQELRGNVDTRLRKLVEGQYDAILLATAGLERLELTQHLRGRFAPEEICPAPAQGALAIECRSDDIQTQNAVATLHHRPTGFAVAVERCVLGALGGGCHLPVGVYCEQADTTHWKVMAVVARPDGSAILREQLIAPVTELSKDSAQVLGDIVSQRLLAQGAHDMIAAAASVATEGDKAKA